MGQLSRAGGAADARFLRVETRVGRTAVNDLVLGYPEISSLHALIRWDGVRWIVRDLNSKNGTTVDGRRLSEEPERELPLREGSVIGFGQDVSLWTVTSTQPPIPFARNADGEELGGGPMGVLNIVGTEGERWSVQFSPRTGLWTATRDDVEVTVADKQWLTASGERWQLHLPTTPKATWELPDKPPQLSDIHLVLVPNADWSLVEMRMKVEGRRPVALGVRRCHLLMLLLHMETQGADRSTGGWVSRARLEARHPIRSMANPRQWIARSVLNIRDAFDGHVIDGRDILESCRDRGLRISGAAVEIELDDEE